MKPGVPWNTKGLRFDATETARETERRSDRFATRPSTVNSADGSPRHRYETSASADWVEQLFPRRHAPEESRNWRPDPRPSLARSELGRSELQRGGERKPRTDTIDGVNRRLDGLARQLDQLARLNSASGSSAQRRSDDEGLRKRATAVARLDQRLDQMIFEGRRAISDIERRVGAVDSSLGSLRQEAQWRSPPDLPFRPEQTVNEIASHPPAQESEAATPSMNRLPDAPHYAGASDGQLSGLQKQIEQLASRIDGATFRPPPLRREPTPARRGPSLQEPARPRATGFGNPEALRR
jgi:hypothetical protein